MSSNLAEAKVTEHRLQVFELAGNKDPVLLHKLTFLTDAPQDWLRSLNFEIQVKGELVLACLTATSSLVLAFALRDKRLVQVETDLSFDASPERPSSCLTARGNSLWVCSSDNKINRIGLK